MTRPQSEAEYLARMVPPSVAALSRRGVLRGGLGLGAAFGGSALLAACGGSSSSASASGSGSGSASAASGTVTFGSNQSDAAPKKVLATLLDNAQKQTGLTVKTNTVDHENFQENINNYLQGGPDDVFTWFAGYRMRFFAKQDLVGDVSDVWNNLQGYTDGFKAASTGDDGKQYFVPQSYYPWAVFYRKSVWDKHGYKVPTTLDELNTLGAQMKKDGLVPIAFADKQGWPAMGTFDVLNMRINGYQYHVDLMAHKKPWTDPGVKKVFETWRSLLPLHQEGALGRQWEDAAKSLQQGKAGMYLLGLFVTQQFKPDELSDVDFFTFPAIDPAIGADALDAPIDGFMTAPNPKNEAGTKKLLEYMGSPEAQTFYAKTDPTTLVANTKADTTAYTALQKKAAELVGSAKNIAQFLDRDADPGFASTVMIPAIQTFLGKPDDIDGLVNSIENQAKSIYTS
jgi:multiple sugar transport system substrate-binding protein